MWGKVIVVGFDFIIQTFKIKQIESLVLYTRFNTCNDTSFYHCMDTQSYSGVTIPTKILFKCTTLPHG